MSEPPAAVLDLVRRFAENVEAYRSANYNEAQVRCEFIDPFFEALGWDVANRAGLAEAYKDVIHEDAIRVGAATKAPDYCFRIGGQRKFFVEAKKPAVSLKDEPEPAYQLRRYAWSARLPLAILTDFQEFAVYNCRRRPSATDKPGLERVMYLGFSEYATRWDEIAAIFSKDAVLKGGFDKYAQQDARKRGTAEVDAEFLKEIEEWRDVLARNLALRNPELTVRELNYAVQMTIDRTLFLRICEDRGVETYGQIMALLNGENTYGRLRQLFRTADDKYNSGLFHFEPEKGRATPPDDLTPRLAIDDKVLKHIIGRLYYPDSPYEFSVLPADILGSVYERFLGKVIRLTAGHQAKVEDKPEVKKAGGVYYTPRYIVDYIVKQTVGKLCEGKRPKQLDGLRVVDPACGSGSFLIGAYEYLLDFHRDWYVSDGPEKHRKELRQGPGGQWVLATPEKKRVLLNNIFGVDIDSQAVEVTKLNLLLKLLEGESAPTTLQRRFAHDRVLPDLGANVKCGNSLIGPDFYNHVQLGMFDEEERYRINAFDWQAEFPQVFHRQGAKGAKDGGGFDAVIGNPPYIRIQALREWAPREVEWYKYEYQAAAKGNYDIYVVFVERGMELLAKQGRLGFILPTKFITTDYGASLRIILRQSGVLGRLVDFGHEQVFGKASTYTCLLFLSMVPCEHFEYIRVKPESLSSPVEIRRVQIASMGDGPWLLASEPAERAVRKIDQQGEPLLKLPALMSRGVSTGADEVFCLAEDEGVLYSRTGEAVDIEREILRKPIYATDFSRFSFTAKNSDWLVFPYAVGESGYELIDERQMRDCFPRAYAYLASQRKQLERRKQYAAWYGFSAPRNLHIHQEADFLVPLLANKGTVATLPARKAEFCVMASAGFTVSLGLRKTPQVAHYVLALVNSRLLFWWLRSRSNRFRGGWITCTKQYFGQIPIFPIPASGRQEVARRDRIVELVGDMLTLQKQLHAARTDHEKTALQRQIEATDRQIDQLVYELYGLTDDEIAIVEGETRE